MRKTKRIKLDDLEITVFELRVRDIRKIMDRPEDADLSIQNLGDFLPLACDLSPEKFAELAPSEIQQIWDAFYEVNTVFFGWTAKAGIDRMFRDLIRKYLTEAFAGLSSGATPASLITDIPST